MDFRAALLDQTRDFGQLIRSADPSTPVPTCPDWTLRQLLRHVGRGNRWAAQIIDDRRTERLDQRDVREGKPPEDPDAAIDWLNEGAQLIINAVDHVGPETRVWTFIGARPCGWWIRRRLHEATVHRADAAFALGLDYELSPELAADGISEWIERVSVQARRQPLPLELGRTLHMHATDDGLGPTGEWTITSDSVDGVAPAVFAELPTHVASALRAKGWRFYQFIGSGGCRLMCAWDTQPETVERFTDEVRALCAAR